jgi:uncharacterized heparinase superfamily protein
MAKALSPLAVELVSARASLAFFRKQVKDLTAQVKHERFALANDKLVKREAKAAALAAKREAAIAKAQARLEKLLAKQVGAVGAKAAKANRKPGKVTTYGAEDNAIASAIMAKKASA